MNEQINRRLVPGWEWAKVGTDWRLYGPESIRRGERATWFGIVFEQGGALAYHDPKGRAGSKAFDPCEPDEGQNLHDTMRERVERWLFEQHVMPLRVLRPLAEGWWWERKCDGCLLLHPPSGGFQGYVDEDMCVAWAAPTHVGLREPNMRFEEPGGFRTPQAQERAMGQIERMLTDWNQGVLLSNTETSTT